MRLLIVDEAIIAGGVETLRFNLVPELAKLCESIVWVLPESSLPAFRERTPNIKNLAFESLSWPHSSPQQLTIGALSCLSRWCSLEELPNWFSRRAVESRIRALAHKHGSAACLVTCAISQPALHIDLPLAAFICDVNPSLPKLIRNNIGSWLSQADAIFGISQFTCHNLGQLASASAAKIHAVPMAAPPRLQPLRSHSEYQSDFYLPAATNAHKGHLILFQACLALAQRGAPFRLILSGPGNDSFRPGQQFDEPSMEPARRFLDEHAKELDGRVVIAGDVPPAEVHALYNSTRCVVLPSRYEGFGLPLAEALQYGRRIICSDIPPFREQLAMYGSYDHAQLIRPGDPVGLANAMEELLRGSYVAGNDFSDLDRRMARWTWADVARRCYDHLSSLIRVRKTG